MNNAEVYPIFFKLLLAFIAALSSALMLSKTRKLSLTLIILGVIFLFVDSLYEALALIGVVHYDWFPSLQFPVLKVLLNGLPFVFFSAGFLISFISRKRY